jgi:cytochrome c oxidase assembly factor CtaG
VVDPWKPALDVEWIAALVLFAVDYLVVVRAQRRRGLAVERRRWLAFSAGLVVIALALLSPIEHLALTSMLSFHMLQNVMIADWAPPLLLLGLTPAMVAAVERWPGIGTAVRPRMALVAWVAAWYLLHLPPVYDYALEHRWALGLEHLTLIVTGLLFWWPDIVPGRLSLEGRVLYLFVAAVVMMPLDFAIALAGHPLYGFYEHTPKLGGISTLADQRIAGVTTLVAETSVLTAAMFVAAAQLWARDRGDRRARRPLDAA